MLSAVMFSDWLMLSVLIVCGATAVAWSGAGAASGVRLFPSQSLHHDRVIAALHLKVPFFLSKSFWLEKFGPFGSYVTY
jgi:hypothetical protein